MSLVISLPIAKNTTSLTNDHFNMVSEGGKKDEFYVTTVGKYSVVTFVKEKLIFCNSDEVEEIPTLWIFEEGREYTLQTFEFAPTHEGLDEMFAFLGYLEVLLNHKEFSTDMKTRGKELRKFFKVLGKDWKFSIRMRGYNGINVECKTTPLNLETKEEKHIYGYGFKNVFCSKLTKAFEWLMEHIIESGQSHTETGDYGRQPDFYAYFSF